MNQITPSFDPQRVTDKPSSFVHSPANARLLQSAVGIVRETRSLRLQIRYGLQDQLVAFDLADIFKKAGGKPLTSGGQEFTEVCDLILQLHRTAYLSLGKSGG